MFLISTARPPRPLTASSTVRNAGIRSSRSAVPAFAAWICSKASSWTHPDPSVVRDRSGSWRTTGIPSADKRTSSSRTGAPRASAASKEARVFSGWVEEAPRWATTSGNSPGLNEYSAIAVENRPEYIRRRSAPRPRGPEVIRAWRWGHGMGPAGQVHRGRSRAVLPRRVDGPSTGSGGGGESGLRNVPRPARVPHVGPGYGPGRRRLGWDLRGGAAGHAREPTRAAGGPGLTEGANLYPARRAQVVHRTDLALGVASGADPSSVLDQDVGEREPLLLRDEPHQIPLDLVRVLIRAEAQALGQPAHVGVDGDPLDP